jgi:enamine deaminase RidA (YjgF/YER057c/UK114 family)
MSCPRSLLQSANCSSQDSQSSCAIVERQRISSGSPWERTVGFARAVRVGDRVLVAGTAPIWPDGSCDPDPEVQARRCIEIIIAALAGGRRGP